jgi:hypothetical protein
MYFEKLGFILTFWNMAGVPFTYCHCALYLANHDPSEYRWSRPGMLAFAVVYLFMYWMWDSSNGQKNSFRQQERGQLIKRKAFPHMPWTVIENPRDESWRPNYGGWLVRHHSQAQLRARHVLLDVMGPCHRVQVSRSSSRYVSSHCSC